MYDVEMQLVISYRSVDLCVLVLLSTTTGNKIISYMYLLEGRGLFFAWLALASNFLKPKSQMYFKTMIGLVLNFEQQYITSTRHTTRNRVPVYYN